MLHDIGLEHVMRQQVSPLAERKAKNTFRSEFLAGIAFQELALFAFDNPFVRLGIQTQDNGLANMRFAKE